MESDLSYKFKDYYETLINNLDAYDGEYASFIDCGPNLFKLMCLLLEQDEITKENRLELSAAIAYYVVPMDVIPEQLYGPYGFIDDIYLATHVLKRIATKHGYDYLQTIWAIDSSIEFIINDCFEKSSEILDDEQTDEILKYVGLI